MSRLQTTLGWDLEFGMQEFDNIVSLCGSHCGPDKCIVVGDNVGTE